MCFDNDGLTCDFYNSCFRKSRKIHGCECCEHKIRIGEQYKYGSGKCDGDLFQVRMCNLCSQDEMMIVQYELEEGCHWNDSWPYNADDQMQWIWDHDDFKRAKKLRDLNECRRELDEFHKNGKALV